MNQSLIKFKKVITFILLISLVLENIFFLSVANFFASLVLIYGWLIIKRFVLTYRILQTYPVSFLMMLGLSLFYYVLPMPLTLIELKPVTYNMRVPLQTFFHHFLFVTAIVSSHFIYIKFSRGKNIFRSILKRTNFYQPPSDKIIWLTAILGLLGAFYTYFIYGAWQRDVTDRNFLYYLTAILSQYIWMPLIIPFSRFRNRENDTSFQTIIFIIVYSVFVLAVAIASNWRTNMFSGILLLFSIYLAGILFGYYDIKEILIPKKFIFIIVLFSFISGPLMDFGYAMIAVRQNRKDLVAVDFLKKTFDIYRDKEAIYQIKTIGSALLDNKFSGGWDERYLNNLILNRFVNLKISDNCLYYANKVGYQNHQMQEEITNQIVASMPNVVLDIFNVDKSKKFVTSSYSIGDYLYSLAIQDPSVRGNSVISSMTGVGMAIFGYWYLLLLIPMFIIIFSMFDSFVIIKNGEVNFSYFFYVMLVYSINYFNDRHVYTTEIRFILRTYFESVFFFLITMKIANTLFLFKIKTEKDQNSIV